MPFWAAVASNVNVVDVAPGMSLKEVPLSVETCHCTVGAGLPPAVDVKLTLAPSHAVWFVGSAVTAGATKTVSSALVVVAVPQELVKTAW